MPDGIIKFQFADTPAIESRRRSQSRIVRILNYRRMTDIDCLSIKPHTTSFDGPNISVLVGATAGNATMRIQVPCLPAYS